MAVIGVTKVDDPSHPAPLKVGDKVEVGHQSESEPAMKVLLSMILGVLAASVFLFVLFTPCRAQECQVVGSEAIRRSPDTPSNEGGRCKLPPNALQMARTIGAESDIEKLTLTNMHCAFC